MGGSAKFSRHHANDAPFSFVLHEKSEMTTLESTSNPARLIGGIFQPNKEVSSGKVIFGSNLISKLCSGVFQLPLSSNVMGVDFTDRLPVHSNCPSVLIITAWSVKANVRLKGTSGSESCIAAASSFFVALFN
jgi:hypothetical protein